MSWTTPEDIRNRWPGAPLNDALLQTWIDDAETIIRAEFPWVSDWIDNDTNALGVVQLVVSRMVIRALSTPAGVNREQVGDTAISYFEQAGLYLSDADRALLEGYGPQTAFTVDTMPAGEFDNEPSLYGAWVNRDGYAPGEFPPWNMRPVYPDPALDIYSPTWRRGRR
jgi:hypothetical protein